MDKTVTRFRIFNAKNYMNAISVVEALIKEGYTVKIVPVKDGSIFEHIEYYAVEIEIDGAIPFEKDMQEAIDNCIRGGNDE